MPLGAYGIGVKESEVNVKHLNDFYKMRTGEWVRVDRCEDSTMTLCAVQ